MSEVPESSGLHPIVQAAAGPLAAHFSASCPGEALRTGPERVCLGCRGAAESLARVAAPAVLRYEARQLDRMAQVMGTVGGDADAYRRLAARMLNEADEIEVGGSQGGDTDG